MLDAQLLLASATSLKAETQKGNQPVSLADKRRLIWEGSEGRENGFRDRKIPLQEAQVVLHLFLCVVSVPQY